jgi:ribose-phosphate pyrophosphokinase
LAVERLKDSELKGFISTNSVPSRLTTGCRVTELSVAGLLGEGIRRIHDDESVSSLFEVKSNK